MPPDRIFLIGYRGTGKTTTGAAVARQLGWPFLDADVQIEEQAGRSIREIFAAEGEVGFRDRESAALAVLAKCQRCVIATGGGAVLRPENRVALRSGFVAWLTAPPAVLLDRIEADPTTASRRPNLTASGGLTEVVRLLAEREPLYRDCADVTLDTSCASPDALATAILKASGVGG